MCALGFSSCFNIYLELNLHTELYLLYMFLCLPWKITIRNALVLGPFKMHSRVSSVQSTKACYIFFHIRLLCVRDVQVCSLRCARGDQWTTSKSWLSHSTRWVLGLELRSSCLAASAATHGAILLLRLSLLYSGLPSDSLAG